LDEPSAGVDVELRRNMWNMVRELRESGVTIILTTHYIEEAEEIADRVGVINGGEIVIVEEKTELMQKLGKKELRLQLQTAMMKVPDDLFDYNLKLEADGTELVYSFDAKQEHTGIAELLRKLYKKDIDFKDLNSSKSSLEEIFVELVKEQ
jgi:ABC-2 type transport system ATP-binding protein